MNLIPPSWNVTAKSAETALVFISAFVLVAGTLTMSALQWTGRWRSWATRARHDPCYAAVRGVLGESPLPPVMMFAGLAVVLVMAAIDSRLHAFSIAIAMVVVMLGAFGLTAYVWLRQPEWSIPPWLRAERRSRRR